MCKRKVTGDLSSRINSATMLCIVVLITWDNNETCPMYRVPTMCQVLFSVSVGLVHHHNDSRYYFHTTI